MVLLRDSVFEPRVVTVVDTVDAAHLRARLQTQSRILADVFNENTGLRGTLRDAENRIRGLEARAPDTVRVAARPVDVSRDTLARPAVAIRGGFATYAVLIPRADSLHEERLLSGIDLRDCDDGFVLGPEGAACNRAALGHLLLFARGGVLTDVGGNALRSITRQDVQPVGAIGVRWQRCYRCTFAVEASIETTGRKYFWGEYGWRPF